jgi:hypothetical protein
VFVLLAFLNQKLQELRLGQVCYLLDTTRVDLYLFSVTNGHLRPRGFFLRLETGEHCVSESPTLRGM